MREHRWDYHPAPCREPAHRGSRLRCHDCGQEFFCAPAECPARRRPGFVISGSPSETEVEAGTDEVGQAAVPASPAQNQRSAAVAA